MTRKLSLAALAATAALALVPTALGQGPDAFERAVDAKLATDATSIVATYPDAVQRAVNAARASAVSTYPDAFQRALDNRISASPTSIPGDHHERIDSFAAAPAPTSVTASRNDVEWPQVGIGFGLGALLALGLVLTLRLVRTRELAH